jgi:VWFA-related protein
MPSSVLEKPVLFATIALTLLPLLCAQQQPSFSVEVDVLQIVATVRDGEGRLVTNLGKEDFILEEEGSPQEIEYFVRAADLPLTIGLLVDSSMSQRGILQEEREASYRFLDEVLRPEEDRVFVISFDVDAELLQDLTSDLRPLQDSLKEVQVPSSEDRRRRVGTVLYDAVFLSSDEIMQEQSGRKALILLSDGVDFGSLVKPNVAIEAAQRADTIIYGIRYYDKNAYSRAGGGMGRGGRGGRPPGSGPGGNPGGRPGGQGGGRPPDGKAVLKELSQETGGTLFEVSKKISLDEVFAQIEEELRNQYIIGFTPKPGDGDDDYRRIRVKTKDKELTVQSRSGYYSKSP